MVKNCDKFSKFRLKSLRIWQKLLKMVENFKNIIGKILEIAKKNSQNFSVIVKNRSKIIKMSQKSIEIVKKLQKLSNVKGKFNNGRVDSLCSILGGSFRPKLPRR